MGAGLNASNRKKDEMIRMLKSHTTQSSEKRSSPESTSKPQKSTRSTNNTRQTKTTTSRDSLSELEKIQERIKRFATNSPAASDAALGAKSEPAHTQYADELAKCEAR